jgi:hypothetical protein
MGYHLDTAWDQPSFHWPNCRRLREQVHVLSCCRWIVGCRVLRQIAIIFGAETTMIKNGLYSLAAVSLDGVDAEVGGVLILRDGLSPAATPLSSGPTNVPSFC